MCSCLFTLRGEFSLPARASWAYPRTDQLLCIIFCVAWPARAVQQSDPQQIGLTEVTDAPSRIEQRIKASGVGPAASMGAEPGQLLQFYTSFPASSTRMLAAFNAPKAILPTTYLLRTYYCKRDLTAARLQAPLPSDPIQTGGKEVSPRPQLLV